MSNSIPLYGDNTGIDLLAKLITAGYHLIMQMLAWVILAIPVAITGVVAQVVGKSGLSVFMLLGIFLVTMLAGLLIHALIYYPCMARWLGKMPIKNYLGQGMDAILMGFSTNSSLATVPVTLRCLTEKMGVSERSARLSALIGTNLNNDGIILYEAMTAIFLAQAIGFSLDMTSTVIDCCCLGYGWGRCFRHPGSGFNRFAIGVEYYWIIRAIDCYDHSLNCYS